MENVTKALIMAGSILIAIIIICGVLVFWNNISDYQTSLYNAEVEEEIVEFNNLYNSYNRDDLRGSEIISLVNRVIEYNKTTAPSTVDGDLVLKITIKDSIKDKLTFDGSIRLLNAYRSSNIYTIGGTDGICGSDGQPDNPFYNKAVKELEAKKIYGGVTSSSTETAINDGSKYLKQLVNNIDTLQAMVESDGDYSGLTHSEIVAEFNNKGWITTKLEESNSGFYELEDIYEDTLYYYEYVYFKRTYFKCTDVKNSSETGKIIEMDFECRYVGI